MLADRRARSGPEHYPAGVVAVLLLTFVGSSIAITLIGSGAGLANRRERSWVARAVAGAGWLIGVYLLYRIGRLWGLA